MSTLRLSLLDTLDIHHGGQQLPKPPTRKAQSLLAYLVLHRDRPQPRDRLIDLHWGDRPERNARQSLSTALWHIRRCLPVDDPIWSDPHTAQFNPNTDLWVDAEEFESRLGRGDLFGLQSAVLLYRGSFMDGFYDDWIIQERNRLELLFAEVLARLMADHEQAADFQAMLATALRLVGHDSLREDAHRAAMRAYCRLGHRNAALEQYRRCREEVLAELDTEPTVETTQLYQAILEGRFQCEHVADAAWVPTSVPKHAAPRGHSPLDAAAPTPLVGREDELAHLSALWQAAQAGQGQIVLVSGEAGVGKTRLVEELADRLRWEGARIAWGRCYEFEGVLPYQPIAEALRTVLATLGPAERAAVFPWAAAEVARLVPEFLEKWPGLELTASAGSEPERVRLFEGVSRFLVELAACTPLLIILEDLHWASESTLRLVHYLARHLAGAPILTVGTFRPETIDLEHPLLALRRRLTREGLAKSLRLPRLTAAAVEELVVAMSGAGDAARPLARRLYQETDGNPFFLMETIKTLFGSGMLHLERGAWRGDLAQICAGTIPLPATVSEAIQARVHRLHGVTQEALRLAAVLGREFDFHLLDTVWGRGHNATLEALDDLLRCRLIDEGTGAMGRDYAFTHHKIQEAIYAATPLRHRQHIHAHAGLAMEAIYGPETASVAGELAFHFDQGQHVDDALAERAIRYLGQAGDAAARVYAYAEARQHYARALEVLSHLPATDENRRCRVDTILQMVSVSFHAEAPEESLARLVEAEGLAQELPGSDGLPGGDRLRLARIHLWMGHTHVYRYALPEAVRCFLRVLPVAQEFGDDELTAIPLSVLGRGMVPQGHFGQAGEMLTQAIPLLEKIGNWHEWILNVAIRGVSLAGRGQYRLAVEEGRCALARALEMHNLAAIAWSHQMLFWIYCIGRDVPRALEASCATLETAEQAGERLVVYWGLGNRGWAESQIGNHDAAFQFMARQQELEQRLGGQLIARDIYAAFHTEVAYNAGDAQRAIALAEHAIGVAQSVGGVYAEGLARRVWGQALAACKPPRWDDAELQLAASLRLHELGEGHLEAARTHLAWGIVCRDQGERAAAREHWEQAAAQFEASGVTGELEQTRRFLAGLVV